jgi:acetolactate synthase-1/2/3 large subunit
VNVTTGPGGINAMNGVFGAFTDSVPMIVLSGQVRYDTTLASAGLPLRQLGDQEYDIVPAVRNMTKHAEMVVDPRQIRLALERALHLAVDGRPGPVWLDIPMNVQGALVDTEGLPGFTPDARPAPAVRPTTLLSDCERILDRLAGAQRPVLYVGSGVRVAGAESALGQLLEALPLPVVTGFNAHDLVESTHPLFAGRPGSNGDRPGNFAVQNSDALLVVGCRLNIRQVGYNWPSFARGAYKVVVDVDPLELAKPTVRPDHPVCADAREFLEALTSAARRRRPLAWPAWQARCRDWRERYPVVLPEYWQRERLVNPYCFVDTLFTLLAADDVVVTGNATACVCTFQAARIQAGQRLYSNSGSASMGYDLPGAIGAAFARPGNRIVCLAGDGSIQMNLQELQTLINHSLPVKLFVLNNDGYHSIRMTQRNFFKGRLVGCDSSSGIRLPDMGRIAAAYGLPFRRCESHATLAADVSWALATPGPVICELMLTPEQSFAPKPSSVALTDGRIVSRPLEDQAPFLPRAEFLESMIVPPLPESLDG